MTNESIPVWKKWLSHLKPVYIESAESAFNPELSVVLDKGRLQLLSGNAIYSWDDLYRNFTVAFETLKPDKDKIKEVLILGLGLGSIPYILEKKHQMQCYYTAVELDETVAELAERYSISRLRSPVEVVIADASIFVEICEEQYDLLVVDIFEDNFTPPAFESVDFLENCRRLIRPGGLLLFNRLYFTDIDKVETDRFYHHVFLDVFPKGNKIDTEGNWVLYAEV